MKSEAFMLRLRQFTSCASELAGEARLRFEATRAKGLLGFALKH